MTPTPPDPLEPAAPPVASLPPLPPVPPLPPLPPFPESTGSTASRSRPLPTPSRVLRALLVLTGGLITLAMLSVCTFTVADALGRTTETTSFTFPDTVKRINIRVHSGVLVLRGGDRTDIRGERRVTHGLQTPSFEEVVEGDTLTLVGGCPIVTAVWCDVSYTIDVPASIAIHAENGAGSIDAGGLSGPVTLRSGAGSVTLDDVSGRLDLSAGAGSVQARRVRSTIVMAESGAGSVDLVFVEPPERVKAQAGAGSVDIEVPRDGSTYDLPSMGAGHREDIEIATDPDSTRTIDAEAGAGSVYVHYPAR